VSWELPFASTAFAHWLSAVSPRANNAVLAPSFRKVNQDMIAFSSRREIAQIIGRASDNHVLSVAPTSIERLLEGEGLEAGASPFVGRAN
jgi:hypothetical protein